MHHQLPIVINALENNEDICSVKILLKNFKQRWNINIQLPLPFICCTCPHVCACLTVCSPDGCFLCNDMKLKHFALDQPLWLWHFVAEHELASSIRYDYVPIPAVHKNRSFVFTLGPALQHVLINQSVNVTSFSCHQTWKEKEVQPKGSCKSCKFYLILLCDYVTKNMLCIKYIKLKKHPGHSDYWE